MPDRFKTITSRAKRILIRDEGYDADFKKNDKFDASDLVAFANSASGGAILLGVDEAKKPDGSQVGIPVGCRLTDELRLTILNRAGSCHPPIDVRIYEENRSKVPFIRIEVPSGPHKPYCTGSGTYKIRDDGANKAITPPFLLMLFVEREAAAFVDRFRDATQQLEQSLEHLSSNIKGEISGITQELAEAHQDIRHGLHEIGDASSEAQANSEDANSLSESAHEHASQALDEIKEVAYSVGVLTSKLDSVLIANKIRDPTIAPGRLNGILYFAIFDGEDVPLEVKRERFFKMLPTAQEEDWEDHLKFYEDQEMRVTKTKKTTQRTTRKTKG